MTCSYCRKVDKYIDWIAALEFKASWDYSTQQNLISFLNNEKAIHKAKEICPRGRVD